jgi:CheY-like chemotaxis protein
MPRILVVEDDADQREIRRLILERSGHTVQSAACSTDALAHVDAHDSDCVLMDLRIPKPSDGLQLIQDIRARDARLPVVVLSGWPEDLEKSPMAGSVSATLKKPVATDRLLRTINRLLLAVSLLLVCCGMSKGQTRSFPFQVAQGGEVLAELTMSSPGSDWAVAGKEGALAAITVDAQPPQHLMVTGPERPYRIFLGRLAAGAHTLKVERQAADSAAGAGLSVAGARFENSDSDFIANAPIVLARLNTLGKFTDVPLMAYCTRGQDADGSFLEYTVIFTNEDGGTSTRDLMARWGRTTDIEYIYRLWLDASGKPKKTLIQTKGHEDVPYNGIRIGSHPVLMPVTDNNMVEPAAANASRLRYQLTPVLADLSDGSREKVMDAAPFTYEIASKELQREGKLRPFGTFQGENISDPRNYLVVEFKVSSTLAGVQVLIQRKGEKKWRGSALGLGKDFIERSGWVRTRVELPPGTTPADLAGFGAECLSQRDLVRQPIAKNGHCAVEAIGRVFFLDQDYKPGPRITIPGFPEGGWQMEAGELFTLALQ